MSARTVPSELSFTRRPSNSSKPTTSDPTIVSFYFQLDYPLCVYAQEGTLVTSHCTPCYLKGFKFYFTFPTLLTVPRAEVCQTHSMCASALLPTVRPAQKLTFMLQTCYGKMDRNERRLPQLTPEELANPYTRISLDGVEVQLWQVAHVYGVSHDMPSPDLRAGASSQDFRTLYSTQDSRGIASTNPSTDTRAGSITEQRPLPSLPVLPLNIPTRPQTQHPTPRVDGHRDLKTNDLLRLIDDFVDKGWPGEVEAEQSQITTTTPAVTPTRTTLKIEGVIWSDPSFPPPSHPPPDGPLPPLPPQSAGSRHPDSRHGPPSTTVTVTVTATVPATAPQLPPRVADKSLEYPESDRDDDAESERTITPRESRRQLAPTARPGARARDVSMPTIQMAPKGPVVAPATTGRAASASILRSRGEEIYRPRRQDSGLSETQPKLASPTLPYPLPDFLLNPPSFLQHPPDLSQQPYLGQQPGVSARGSPQLNKSKSSSNMASPVTSPATPTSDDDVAVTSRWSSDSEEEGESKLKKLKRVLSFSRLRPRKSSLFQKQTGDDANKSVASIGGKHTPGPSGSRRSSKTGN
ncbi:uncharacterized protein B0H64DRAFT_411654 [Chaetomium fimeti]|uniref:Uncharacterized protein n=1 Tax=Chaetomium fimeti TaxID=1854472 RepID=A0AAE0H5Z6_9PEZI|nr:hypothetical protein B0H64DRAFT_411654 [Chaetomium fimeti]